VVRLSFWARRKTPPKAPWLQLYFPLLLTAGAAVWILILLRQPAQSPSRQELANAIPALFVGVALTTWTIRSMRRR
jgi:hypothetical protein